MLRGLIVTAAAGAAAVQASHLRRNWGATAEEIEATLPGDEFVPDPAEQTTIAVPVHAPAEEIWAWLVQMGQDRGGMYSYDWLENLIGLDIDTTDEIREEWQHLSPGDRVVVVPEGHGPIPTGFSFRVARVHPGRALVLRQSPRSTRGTASGPSTSSPGPTGAAACWRGRGPRWRDRSAPASPAA